MILFIHWECQRGPVETFLSHYIKTFIFNVGQSKVDTKEPHPTFLCPYYYFCIILFLHHIVLYFLFVLFC